MVFRKMSVAGVSFGQNDMDCEDAFEKNVTNFNMVDSDLNTVIQSVNNGSNSSYEHIQRFLYHLALCHTAMTVSSKEGHTDNSLCSPSPDELALINAAKYYGIKFVERNQYNEIIIENDHHQQSQLYKFELLDVIEFNSDRKRMTVIVKAPNGEIKVLSKGADSVLSPLLNEKWEN
jgi:magnesium-transporting ATPase (P-type)